MSGGPTGTDKALRAVITRPALRDRWPLPCQKLDELALAHSQPGNLRLPRLAG